MPILVECPSCKHRQNERYRKCRRCGLDLSRARNKVYWIEYYVKELRKKKRERIGPWKSLAEQVLAKRKSEIAENRFLDKLEEPPEIPLREFVKHYIEWCTTHNKSPETKRTRLKPLLAFFGNMQLSEISPWLIEKYKSKRRKEVSPSTVNKELTVLRHLFNKAIQWGYARENPLKHVEWYREPKGKLRFLSAEEIAALLQAAPLWLQRLILFALNTGMRRGEILSLTWDSIDFENGLIYVSQSKSGEARHVPMNNVTREILLEVRKEVETISDYVFINPKTGTRRVNIRKAFRRTCKAAGVTGCTFHTLRHTFASHLVMRGIDLKTVSELLGHKSINMTMRYAHLSPDHKRLSMKSIQEVTVKALSIKRQLAEEQEQPPPQSLLAA